MRIEWLKFDDYVPARIKKKSLGFVSFLRMYTKLSLEKLAVLCSSEGKAAVSVDEVKTILMAVKKNQCQTVSGRCFGLTFLHFRLNPGTLN